jgi:hypothetical protein
MGNRPLALVCQCYTSNLTLTTDLEALVPVYSRLRLIPNVVATIIFSDYGRATGLCDHPEVRLLWEEFARTVQLPPIEVPVMEKPVFTIWEPKFPITGPAPLRVRCEIRLAESAGAPDWIEWQYSTIGRWGPWKTAVRNPGHDHDHTYNFTGEGEFWIKARAGNAAGEEETLAERKVTVQMVTEPPIPPEPPQPQPSVGEPYKTLNGHYLRVGENSIIDARADKTEGDSTDKFVAAKIVQVHLFEDIYALKIGDQYIQAEHGGGGKLKVVTRSQPFSDEEFRIGRIEGGFFIQANHHGQYTCAEGGGGEEVNINRQTPQGWETFTAPGPSLPSIVKRTGPVGLNNKCYSDAGGTYLAFGFSLFAAGSLYRDNRAGLDADCGNMATRGANCVRWMGEVGPPLFTHRELDPTSPDWEDIVRGNVAYMYDNFGLRSDFVIFGGTDWSRTAQQRADQVDRVARIFQDLKVAIQSVRIVNEGWQTYNVDGMGHDQALDHIRDMARRLKSQLDVLVSTTDVPNGQEIGDFYTGTVVNIGAQHLDRSAAEDRYRHSRIAWEARANFPPFWDLEEPRGPKSSVVSEEDPTRLISDMVNGYLSGFGSYIFHTGAGVTSGGPNDTHVHGEQRIFDHPTAQATADAMGAALSYLPSDLPNWDRKNWWEDGHPFFRSLELFDSNNHRIGQDYNNPEDHGVGMVCHFSTSRGHQWVTAPTGIHHQVILKANRNIEYDVRHHLTGEILQHISLAQGQSHELLGPERGGQAMYILVGENR